MSVPTKIVHQEWDHLGLMQPDKKSWQYGYELDDLKRIEKGYERYNSYALSPFGKYKKNDVARDLYDGSFKSTGTKSMGIFSWTEHFSKVKTPITMYQDVKIAIKLPGDLSVAYVNGDPLDSVDFFSYLHKTRGYMHPIWLGLWAEDHDMTRAARLYGFSYVGTKITTFGEMYEIYFKEPQGMPFGDREFCNIDSIHYKGLVNLTNMLGINSDDASLISNQIKANLFDKDFENHYSNYNVKDSWSAVSLRGYSEDPTFIGKPIELSKQWKKENPGWENWKLKDTPLMSLFSKPGTRVKAMCDTLIVQGWASEIHRVRFMRLRKNEGELNRHTDQVDPDSGFEVNKVARLHWPIVTNDFVKFECWQPRLRDWNSSWYHHNVANMALGECWALDTRKPHKVINKGDVDRIHLVIDVKVTPKLYNLILTSPQCTIVDAQRSQCTIVDAQR